MVVPARRLRDMTSNYVPETTSLWLPPGRTLGRPNSPTPHTFVRVEPAPDIAGHGRVAMVLIYRCDRTGVERRWGVI